MERTRTSLLVASACTLYDVNFCGMELESIRAAFGRFPCPSEAYLDSSHKFDGETIRQMGIAFEYGAGKRSR